MISKDIISFLKKSEVEWLENIFEIFDGYPNLEQLWFLMDEIWNEYKCDSNIMDSKIDNFYSHPIWLLNGLFIEQDNESLNYRNEFVDWIVKKNPKKIADFGGGFGGLGRMIGSACPNSSIEIIDEYPHPAAIAIAERTHNVRYKPKLTNKYDIIVATDVFEHIPDPLGLAKEIVKFIRKGGFFLIANCFEPVILCHLPQTFHFRHTWPLIMKNIGLTPKEKVAYGQAFIKNSLKPNLKIARLAEKRSQDIFKLTSFLPGRLARPLLKIILPKVN